MSVPPWRQQAIDKNHNRKGFNCRQATLATFLAQHAHQAHESRAAKTYCAIYTADGSKVLGFNTITPGRIEMDRVPLAARPGGGGRHAVGGFQFGRLAVAKSWHGLGLGLGRQLLAMSVERCMRALAELGGTALMINEKDEAGVA